MIKRKLHPAGYRILVKLIKKERPEELKTEAGIVVVNNENYKQIQDEFGQIRYIRKNSEDAEREHYATQEAYIVALGVNAFKAFDNGEPWCKEGDKVLISKYSGVNRDDIEDGEIYRLINDDDVHGIFVGEELNVR